MTSDDRFDEVLQEAAREHNRAPETPRAEMWAAIAAARGASDAGSTESIMHDVPVRVLPFTARQRRMFAVVAALAATLVIGVVIGRRTAATSAHGAPAPAVAQSSPPATGGAPRLGAADVPSGGTGPVIPSPVAPSVALHEDTTRAGTLPDARTTVRVASSSGGGRTPRATDATATEATLPYRVATMQHLVATEALLVALRSDARAGRSDTTIATWAGDLLGTTRMLIDSPAAKDRQFKQLLEDLELVLAQISRLPGAHGEAADLGIIDDAVRHRQIMTRLRALSPET
ncbi:MAG: hypothetical protein ACJ79K_18310 [Gemmatimonadaceae bacterium]